jgi:hypothetical protein
MRWLLDLLTRRRRARAWRLDHAHDLLGGGRRPLGVWEDMQLREWE